jgi:hypothetical protein
MGGTAERILLTHDVKTMPGYAYERMVAGLPVPGIIEASTGRKNC